MEIKQLSRLNRKELLTMLLEVTKQKEALQEEIEQLQHQLDQKEITMNSYGTLAEATVGLSEIFQRADEAAKTYLENIQRSQSEKEQMVLEGKQEFERIKKECSELELSTMQKCARLEEASRQRCQELEIETQKKCEEMLTRARQEAEEYNQSVMEQINHLKDEYTKTMNFINTGAFNLSSLKGEDNDE